MFGILQQEFHSYNKGSSEELEKEDLKKIKIDFIKQCGYARGIEENKKLNSKETIEDGDFGKKVTIKFKSGGTGSTLIPTNDSDFDYWFNKSYKNNKST